MERSADLKVFITNRDSTCDECGENLGPKAWITLNRDKGALCLACADLDHLVFLPSGNTALTRRSHDHSTLSAVVLKWSKSRERYERQGLLVEEEALKKAERECLADEEIRARQREREAERRAKVDSQYIERFAKLVRALFPGCPPGREVAIAEHACLKYSGRIGRTATAKSLAGHAIRLAVIAHVRHVESSYDTLLAMGLDRGEARARVAGKVDKILSKWQRNVD
ncbi:MAG TPA: DUF2293 domain-containing protein [Nitrospiraceae bacterium]|jgi:hypothetical protein|nr:DUF2293 domain-containing protein [Nitrospiraceae bacterium]